jgi:hypothetical protein
MSQPGWYEDPYDPSQRRWWDGAAWSAEVRPGEASVTGDAAGVVRTDTPTPAAKGGKGGRPQTLFVNGALALVRRARSQPRWALKWCVPAVVVAAAAMFTDIDAFVSTLAYVAPLSVWAAHQGRDSAGGAGTRPSGSQMVWFYGGAVASAVPLAAVLSTVAPAALAVLAVAVVVGVAISMFQPSSDTAGTVTRGANSHLRADGRPKVGYRSRAEAQAAASDYERNHREAMSAYRCADCPGWHIGHTK